jgi:hypothetical protein
LPLCFGELWRVDQLPRTLSGWFVLVDDEAPEGSARALWSERARSTLIACPDVVVSAVPMYPTAIVQGLTGGADIAIVFRFVGPEFRSAVSALCQCKVHQEGLPLSLPTMILSPVVHNSYKTSICK